MTTFLDPELASIFERLEGIRLRWCVLRLPWSAAKEGGDVDLLLHASDVKPVRAVMEDAGFVELTGWGGGIHFVNFFSAPERWLWLHFVTELSFGPRHALRTPAAEGCLERRSREGAYPSLDPDDAFWALLMHCLLDKRAIPTRHRGALHSLARQARSDTPLAQCFATVCPCTWTPAGVLDAARNEEWHRLEDLGQEISLTFKRTTGAIAIMREVKDVLAFLRHIRHRRGLAVAVLGPDGAGKSTLVAGIRDSFIFPVQPLYMGLTGGWLRYSEQLRILPLIILARYLVLWGRYIKAHYHMLRGRLVIFDRYTYDAVAPTPYALTWAGHIVRRLDRRACPAPDLVLLLDAPGMLMHARKAEYTPSMLETWRGHFLSLRGHVRQLEVIDASRPIDEVRVEAISRIWRRYTTRLAAGV
jgi:thymidylate kinase